MSASDRTAAEELMMRVARYYYKVNCGFQENHLFDNHFWQQNMRILFQVALSLYDKPAYSSEVLPMMEYYYELWTARAPASGFNRDGIWHNGTGYFSANILTLAYMPSLLSFISQYDYLSHPWYQNVGRSLVYTCPPGSKSNGFGDNSEKGSEPNRLVAAFADYLACETGDSYAGWYAGECRELLRRDYELRLYRMCTEQDYNTAFPAGADKMVWYKDAGEVAMHSAPEDVEKDLALSFRSSTFGSGSHTTASQNAFNLLYKGVDVYRSTGYYQNFSDAHNLMSYRHTRAHNSLLVNGIGQPYSTEGYGSVMRAMGGQHISYCLGDASHAYRSISNDPMWVDYFKQAGIEQTPENGFGATPLTKYRRHVLMLHPHTVIVYDELEASEAVRWEWLLHSPTEFKIDAVKKTLQESLFGEVVYLTVENHSEPFDCILDAYHHARNACKLFGNGKRLRKETLHTARTVHDQFIFFRKFLHTKDGDDVLQFLVALQNLFHALCYVIMFLSHDVRVKDTGRRSQWIDSRIDTQFRNLTVEHGRCIQMAEGCCRSRKLSARV